MPKILFDGILDFPYFFLKNTKLNSFSKITKIELHNPNRLQILPNLSSKNGSLIHIFNSISHLNPQPLLLFIQKFKMIKRRLFDQYLLRTKQYIFIFQFCFCIFLHQHPTNFLKLLLPLALDILRICIDIFLEFIEFAIEFFVGAAVDVT